MTNAPAPDPSDSAITHAVRIFVAPLMVLARFRDLAPMARIYALTSGSDLLVLPFDEAVQDALHRVNGTGDWPPEASCALSTTDMAFAAETSRRGPLAYLETDYHGPSGRQTAALWMTGQSVMPPTTIDVATALSRPPTFWPINAALRSLGVEATATADEFTTFGLRAWTSNADIHAHARRMP